MSPSSYLRTKFFGINEQTAAVSQRSVVDMLSNICNIDNLVLGDQDSNFAHDKFL